MNTDSKCCKVCGGTNKDGVIVEINNFFVHVDPMTCILVKNNQSKTKKRTEQTTA